MTADEYCQEKTQHSNSSFYYSFLFLNNEQRQAMTALYAYCREIDDIVDECSDPSIAANKLNWWKEEVHKLFHGSPSHPVTIALKTSIQCYPLQEKYFLELIYGMEMDLYHSHYATFSDLSSYCYHVASVVGLLTISILGYKEAQTEQYAQNLGISCQLINILRDVKEDAQRGRIYIPQDELQQFSVTQEMLLSDKNTPETLALFRFQAQRAEHYYHLAFTDLAQTDRYTQRTGIIMSEIYFSLLQKIKKQHYPVLQKRISLSPFKKLWLAWTTARREYKYNKRK